MEFKNLFKQHPFDKWIKKNKKFVDFYIKIAEETANLSYCKRLKVGAILVKDNSIISYGYNGTLPGLENKCENENNETYKHVLHAEQNAILKVARSTNSTENAIMFCTHLPCEECAKLIITSGIIGVFWKYIYRNTKSIELFKKCNVKLIRID